MVPVDELFLPGCLHGFGAACTPHRRNGILRRARIPYSQQQACRDRTCSTESTPALATRATSLTFQDLLSNSKHGASGRSSYMRACSGWIETSPCDQQHWALTNAADS